MLYAPIVNIGGASAPELRFFYHMYGSGMGTLSVEVSDDGGSNWMNVWSLSGQQQTSSSDPWLEAVVDLSSFNGNINVRFIGTAATSITGDMAIDDVSIAEEPRVCPGYNPIATSTGAYEVQIDWNGSGASEYSLHFRRPGENWGSVRSTDTTQMLRNIAPGTLYYFISESGNANLQCDTSSTAINCGNISFNTIGNNAVSAALGGNIFVNQFDGGRKPYQVGIVDSADMNGDTTWSPNRTASHRFRGLMGQTYYVFLRDDYGCYSSQIDTVRLDVVDASLIPVQNPPVKNGTNINMSWSISDPSLVNAYQVRVQDVTNGGNNATLFGAFIVPGGASTTYQVTGLPNGRYRVDVRARPVGGTFADGVYSNYFERIINVAAKGGSSSDLIGSLSDLVEVYPNPTADHFFVVAPQGSKIELMEMSGKVLSVQSAEAAETKFAIGHLANGAYMVRITNNDDVVIDKVIKD